MLRERVYISKTQPSNLFISLKQYITHVLLPLQIYSTSVASYFAYSSVVAPAPKPMCLRPAGEEEDCGEDGDGDLAGVTVLVSPTSAFSLSSSPSLTSIEGGSGGERPARLWGSRQGGLRAMAVAEAAGLGELHGWSSLWKKGGGEEGGRRGCARVSSELSGHGLRKSELG